MKLKELVGEYGECNISKEMLEMLKAEKINCKTKCISDDRRNTVYY